jgi:hypothetical protein
MSKTMSSIIPIAALTHSQYNQPCLGVQRMPNTLAVPGTPDATKPR